MNPTNDTQEPKKIKLPLYYKNINTYYNTDKDKVLTQVPDAVNQHAEILVDLDERIKKLEAELAIKEEQIAQERDLHQVSMAVMDNFYRNGIIEDLKRRIKDLEAERKEESRLIAQQLELPQFSKSF